MFSFRTTPLEDQMDKALQEGRVAVFCTQGCWDAEKQRYTYDIFASRGNLSRIYTPDGEHIDFNPDDLTEYDAVVVDIQDVGSRYFTYTIDVLRLMSALKVTANAPSLYIVDHFNPAGRDVEGTLPAGDADVWTPKVAHRHGLTIGELCNLYHDEISATYALHVISATASSSNRILMPWTIPPAADFPGVFTPYFYTGGNLWCDTTVTPGIGTSRPYEFIGAPWMKPESDLVPCPEGVKARPCSFTPLSGPYSGEKCFGYQFILYPGTRYHSLSHTVKLMRHFSERYSAFFIREDLFTRLADPVMAEYLKGRITYDIVEEHIKSEEQKWIRKAKRYLLYEDAPCRIK